MFPTRMTLGTTKIRLKGAQNGHSLLKRKADAISKRFRTITGKIQDAKRQMGIVLQQAAFSMVEVGYTTGDIGYAVRENAKRATFKVRSRQENISGVVLPSFAIQSLDGEPKSESSKDSAGSGEFSLTGLSRGGQQVQKARDTYSKALRVLVDLASLQTAFVILDEAQNTTPEQMKMFLTRLGFGSKMVVTGDTSQVDLPGGMESGLKVVQRILTDIEGVHFAHLDASDVVRHRLVGEIVGAYDRYDATKGQRR